MARFRVLLPSHGVLGSMHMKKRHFYSSLDFLIISYQMKMLPVSRNWESHIRCLAAAVARRGSNFSQANHDLLASSRLLLVRVFLSIL